MALKRSREEEHSAGAQLKKPRTAFKVGPDNLPDGSWRRKVVKIKKDLIHKAKVKKSYAKVKAREPPVDRPIPDEPIESRNPIPGPSQELHPGRQAMLDAPQEDVSSIQKLSRTRSDQRWQGKPKYFEKEQDFAVRKKAEAEARRQEFQRRDKNRKQKIEERERYRSAMAKARIGGRNGQRKLGRESEALLERVKRVVLSPGEEPGY